jgi:[acyl-carrier-protein] S-malonyltransferase
MKEIAYIFPGQGSQVVGMGKSFYENSIEAKELISNASDLLSIDFFKLFEQGNYNGMSLDQTEYSQPAILLISSIAHKLFTDTSNLKAKFSLGHSLGEFSALVSANALDILDAVELVHKRGLFMKEACSSQEDVGMMVVLGLSDEKLEVIIKDLQNEDKKIWCANYNNDGQVVLAGIKKDLESSMDIIKKHGAKRVMLLNMSIASHCPLLEDASGKLKDILEDKLKDNFSIPVISNVTASAYSTKKEALVLLPKQLISPVLYKQSVLKISDHIDVFIEFGHSTVLKGLNKKITKIPTINIKDHDSLNSFYEELK